MTAGVRFDLPTEGTTMMKKMMAFAFPVCSVQWQQHQFYLLIGVERCLYKEHY
jgi:hypothetical protein